MKSEKLRMTSGDDVVCSVLVGSGSSKLGWNGY